MVSFLVYKHSQLPRQVPVDSICGFLSSLDGVFVDPKDKGFSLLMSFVPWSNLLCKIDLGYFGFKILM